MISNGSTKERRSLVGTRIGCDTIAVIAAGIYCSYVLLLFLVILTQYGNSSAISKEDKISEDNLEYLQLVI